MGMMVDDTVIALYGDRWQLDLLWKPFHNVHKYQITAVHLKLTQ